MMLGCWWWAVPFSIRGSTRPTRAPGGRPDNAISRNQSGLTCPDCATDSKPRQPYPRTPTSIRAPARASPRPQRSLARPRVTDGSPRSLVVRLGLWRWPPPGSRQAAEAQPRAPQRKRRRSPDSNAGASNEVAMRALAGDGSVVSPASSRRRARSPDGTTNPNAGAAAAGGAATGATPTPIVGRDRRRRRAAAAARDSRAAPPPPPPPPQRSGAQLAALISGATRPTSCSTCTSTTSSSWTRATWCSCGAAGEARELGDARATERIQSWVLQHRGVLGQLVSHRGTEPKPEPEPEPCASTRTVAYLCAHHAFALTQVSHCVRVAGTVPQRDVAQLVVGAAGLCCAR